MIEQYSKGMPVSGICKAQKVTRRVFYVLKEEYDKKCVKTFYNRQRKT